MNTMTPYPVPAVSHAPVVALGVAVAVQNPHEDSLRAAVRAGYTVGQYLCTLTAEERSSFKLGVLAAFEERTS